MIITAKRLDSNRCREQIMRPSAFILVILCASFPAAAAEVESRRLTHYLPQDFLEAAVRKEGWTELRLPLK